MIFYLVLFAERSEISTEPSQMVEVTWDDPETRYGESQTFSKIPIP